MPSQEKEKKFSFEGPARYDITVQGAIDPKWSDRLAGMHITTKDGKDGAPLTTLTGHLLDQAELSGVLNSLYELHLPIVSVVLAET